MTSLRTSKDFDVVMLLWKFATAAYYPDDKKWDASKIATYLPPSNLKLIKREHMTVLLAESAENLVVTFAGTNDASDVKAAIEALFRVPYPTESSKTHVGSGWLNGLNLVKDDLIFACQDAVSRGLSIAVTGHSAGGAYAMLLADMLARLGIRCTDVVTFGSPRLFGPRLAKEFTALHVDSRVIRVTHAADLVPHSPLCLRFRHVGVEWWLPRSCESRLVIQPSCWRLLWQFIVSPSKRSFLRDHKVATLGIRLAVEHSWHVGNPK